MVELQSGQAEAAQRRPAVAGPERGGAMVAQAQGTHTHMAQAHRQGTAISGISAGLVARKRRRRLTSGGGRYDLVTNTHTSR